ncbi:Imm32 family immunity protein [Mucilaginibacter sp. McL0603]|uniref:Imm32 family immunity protein n=1 Tax=Mucilaginibacter sp. McL0603 TaxID=3415670 RepID=UPI003CE9F66D
MVLVLEIPEYEEREGIKIHWEYGFEIIADQSNNRISIQANKAGLTSLAIQLLTLAQDAVPSGSHIHYDEHNSLESGSKEFIIGKK